jgi:hypothetical protein
MSSDKSELSSAIVQLRASFKESQQRFSDRLKVSLTTVARWELGERNPSLSHLKEFWFLSEEQNRPDLGQVFANEFLAIAGHELTAGETGFMIRRKLSDLNIGLTQLLLDEKLSEEGKAKLGFLLHTVQQVRDDLRGLDLEPPFRRVVVMKEKKK